MEKKVKYLEMIQTIITRMSSHSFSLKGWAVTLVVGTLALAGKNVEKAYYAIAFIPIIMFWGLDSYYLMKERQFRSLYEKAQEKEERYIDFSLDINLPGLKAKKNDYWNCVFSKTELFFYGPLMLVTVGVIIIAFL